MGGKVGAHAYQRIQVHTLAPEPRALTVAPAEDALGHHDGVGRVEPVRLGELGGDLGERRSLEHPLDGTMTSSELPPTARTEVSPALLEDQGAPLLVVDSARGASAEEGQRGAERPRAGTCVP